jgi:LysM repeat protein
VAERFGVPRGRLLAANPELADPDSLLPGRFLRIPLINPTLPPIRRVSFEYVVQPGDTFTELAERFGVSVAVLRRGNPLVDPQLIFPGQVLYIPTVADPPPPPVAAVLQVVMPGDTLTGIAARYRVTLEDLQAANPQVIFPEAIFAGELLAIPVAGVPPAAVFPLRRFIVQPGDTFESVSLRFDVRPQALVAINPLPAAIPGLILVIPAPILRPPVPVAPPGFPGCRPAPFGQFLPLADDDAIFVRFPDDFHFRFFGNIHPTGVWVNSNGNLTFDQGDTTFSPTLDQLVEGPPRIAALWTDLLPPGAPPSGGVFAGGFIDPVLNCTRFAVTWDRVPFFFTEAYNTVQVILNPDGTIQICFFGLAAVGDFRVFIGVARGEGSVLGNAFLYDAGDNPRRLGNPRQPTPQGDLSGQVLLYRFEPAKGNYVLITG